MPLGSVFCTFQPMLAPCALRLPGALCPLMVTLRPLLPCPPRTPSALVLQMPSLFPVRHALLPGSQVCLFVTYPVLLPEHILLHLLRKGVWEENLYVFVRLELSARSFSALWPIPSSRAAVWNSRRLLVLPQAHFWVAHRRSS